MAFPTPMPRHFSSVLEANGECTDVLLIKQRISLAKVMEALVLAGSASDAGYLGHRLAII